MRTLLLDRTTWDLCLDIHGNIAVADEPYAIVQDVASYVRTFLGEGWYNTQEGIPYFEQIMGKWPPLSLLKSIIEDEAKKVPNVVSATAFFDRMVDRRLTGQIQITTTNGQTFIVPIRPPPAPPVHIPVTPFE